jgi:signal transduction histidine kinase
MCQVGVCVKISTKMIGVLFLSALLVAIIGSLGIFANQQSAESFEELKDYEKKVDVAAEASSYAKRAEGHLLLYLTLGNSIDEEKFFARHASLEEQVTILENEIESLEGLEQVNSLKSFSADILEYGSQLLEIYNENPAAFDFEDHDELIINFHDSSSGARRTGVAIVDLETSGLNQDIEQAQIMALSLQRVMMIFTLLLIIASIALGVSIVRSISKPIKKIRDAAIEIGNGKLGIQIDIKSKNEIGDLANSLNKMSNKLKVTQEQLLEAERHSALEAATWLGHDLRNPLQVIVNSVYCINKEISRLQSSPLIRQKITKFLQMIAISVEYAENIVRNLKAFGSKQEPDKTKTDTNTLIKETLSQINTPENIEIIEDLGQIPDANIDKDMMKRVFMNLVTNAFQAMENGGKLKVSTKKTTGFVEVSFQDTGHGMSKETMEKIFEPFFTMKPKGMGIGLTICKQFVERNGGSIIVKSEENEGSTFIVKLPI